MTILEMKAQRANIWEQMKTLASRSEEEKRTLTGEEQTVWDRMEADLEDLRVKVEHAEQAERLEALRASLDKANDPQRHYRTPEQIFLDEARSLFRGDSRVLSIPYSQADVRTALQVGATPGSKVIAPDFLRVLREYLIEFSGIRQAGCTLLVTNGGETMTIPRATAHPTAALIGETSQITESEPTFDQVALEAYKYANLQYLTSEFLEDEVVGVLDYLARQNGMALANAMGNDMITGAGTAGPLGMCHATNGVDVGKTGTTGQTTTVTGDDLVDLYHSILPGYRNRAVFMMSDATVAAIRKIKDLASGSNQYLWQPGLTAGAPDLLLGKAIVVDPYVPDMSASVKSILFGDFSAGYYIREVGNVRIERSDDFKFDTDIVTLRTIMRVDGTIVDAQAVKAYKNSAT